MKAHVCIGGPLDGQFAVTSDFERRVIATRNSPGYFKKGDVLQEGGMYGHLRNEYHQFNNANRAFNKTKCHVVWLHTSLLKAPVAPRER